MEDSGKVLSMGNKAALELIPWALGLDRWQAAHAGWKTTLDVLGHGSAVNQTSAYTGSAQGAQWRAE